MDRHGEMTEKNYRILRELGRGGTSIVYLSEDPEENRLWAVKELCKSGDDKSDEILVKNFLTEARLLQKLKHSSIPGMRELTAEDGKMCLVMDYMEGTSLERLIKEHGPQAEAQVLEWGQQLCEILLYLHQQDPPIIYRDLKPSNIILAPDGSLKLIDFGIAREKYKDCVVDTVVLGTKGYAPPEQYQGRTDERSDIYMLGKTLAYFVTGADPKEDETQISVRAYDRDLSEGMERIIERCTEEVPERRYQNCGELLHDLKHPWQMTSGYRKLQRRRLDVFWGFVKAWGFALLLGMISQLLISSRSGQTKALEEGLFCFAKGCFAAAAGGLFLSVILWFWFRIPEIYREQEKRKQHLQRMERRDEGGFGALTEELCRSKKQILMKEEILIVHTEEELE